MPADDITPGDEIGLTLGPPNPPRTQRNRSVGRTGPDIERYRAHSPPEPGLHAPAAHGRTGPQIRELRHPASAASLPMIDEVGQFGPA